VPRGEVQLVEVIAEHPDRRAVQVVTNDLQLAPDDRVIEWPARDAVETEPCVVADAPGAHTRPSALEYGAYRTLWHLDRRSVLR
jgi:hypothetical protein